MRIRYKAWAWVVLLAAAPCLAVAAMARAETKASMPTTKVEAEINAKLPVADDPKPAGEAVDSALPENAPPQKATLGWIEPIVLYPVNSRFDAKLDTGAKTSSIDAQHIERFQDISGKEWVRFSIETQNGKRYLIERPVKRWVRIKMKRGGYMQRPVVTVGVCLAGHYIEGEVNLTRRFNFNYPILIGRNMLRGRVVVDVAKRRSSTPACVLPETDLVPAQSKSKKKKH